MLIELWLTFSAASAALLAIPGPTVLLVVSYALGQGCRIGWAMVSGVTLGHFTAMTVSILGAGAVLATSAMLFTALKLAGAAYLVWLGLQLWRTVPAPEARDNAVRARGSGTTMFWNTYVVTALNPKTIVFFVAFLPQFVVTDRPLLPQVVILEATFLFLAAVNAAFWTLLAGEMCARFARPATLRLMRHLGGSFLIGAGLLTALLRWAG